jgi:putative transposase
MPKPVTFGPGVQYLLAGVAYEILEVLNDGNILVQTMMPPQQKGIHQANWLRQHWRDGTLRFALPSETNVKEEKGLPFKISYEFADLHGFPRLLALETWHRYRLIYPLLKLAPRERTQEVIQERIKAYQEELLAELNEMLKERKPVVLLGHHIGKGIGPRKHKDTSAKDALDHLPRMEEKENDREEEETSAEAPVSLEDQKKEREGGPEPRGEVIARAKHFLSSITRRTVQRWIRRFKQGGGDIRCLAPSYHKNGPQDLYMIPAVQDALKKAIYIVYKKNRQAPVTKVHEKVKELIYTLNEGKLLHEQLTPPSRSTVYRFVAFIDPAEVGLAYIRQAAADRASTGQGPQPTRPNEQWEFDFARLDILVVDQVDRLPIGRPTIAAIRDKYTGYPVGIFISFEPPSYRLVMECLMYAILEKDHVKQTFHTRNEYLPYGVPETLVVDNALELHLDLELACLQLGIELIHTPVKKPWFKGSIERWFKTVDKDLIHTLPGTTFSNFLQRGEYDSHAYACMTLDGLWEVLHRWIVDDYTQSDHRGIGDRRPGSKYVPAKLWTRALEQDFIPALPPNREELLVLVSRTTERKVHHYGIEFENIVYQSTALRALRKLLKRPDAPEYVQVKYHPGDLSRIWIRNPFAHLYPTMRAGKPKYTAELENLYLEIPAVSQEYTAGLSLWKHLVIKRYAREELKRDIDEEALLLARAELQAFIYEEFRVSRKIRSRMGSARFIDIQIANWMSESAVTSPPKRFLPLPQHSPTGDTENEQKEPSPLVAPTKQMGLSGAAEELPDLSIPALSFDEDVELLVETEADEGQEEPPLEKLPPVPDKTAPSRRSGRPRKQNQRSQEDQGGEPSASQVAQPALTPPSPSAFGIEVSYNRLPQNSSGGAQ